METTSGTRQHVVWALLACVLVVVLPARAAGQEPVKSFDQLSTRLKIGDTVWVTDTRGHEIKGKIRDLGAFAITLDSGGPQSFQAGEVRLITVRKGRRIGTGALYGLLTGAALGAILGAVSDSEDCPGSSCALDGAGFFGGLGAGAGAAVGAMFRGKERVVYRAPDTVGGAPVRLSFAPVITPQQKGIVVVFSF